MKGSSLTRAIFCPNGRPLSHLSLPSLFPSFSISAQPLLGAISAPFSTTPQVQARKKLQRAKKDPRIRDIRYHLGHPLTPRPLRFSRLRALRHWTIHRAYQMFKAKSRAMHQLELERQYNSMRGACEALRTEIGDGGRLFRTAMSKKGIWGVGRVPLEYARIQTEGPPRDGWNHEWKRGS